MLINESYPGMGYVVNETYPHVIRIVPTVANSNCFGVLDKWLTLLFPLFDPRS